MVLGVDAAIVAHLDHFDRVWIREHRMIAGELFGDLFDSRFDAK